MICGCEGTSAFCQEEKVNFFFLNFSKILISAPDLIVLYFRLWLSVCSQNHHERVPLRQTTVWCFRSGGALCWWKIKAWLPQRLCLTSLSGSLKGVFHCQGTILSSVLSLKVYTASQQWPNIKNCSRSYMWHTFSLLSYFCFWQNTCTVVWKYVTQHQRKAHQTKVIVFCLEFHFSRSIFTWLHLMMMGRIKYQMMGMTTDPQGPKGANVCGWFSMNFVR